jgi:hypothetical protein
MCRPYNTSTRHDALLTLYLASLFHHVAVGPNDVVSSICLCRVPAFALVLRVHLQGIYRSTSTSLSSSPSPSDHARYSSVFCQSYLTLYISNPRLLKQAHHNLSQVTSILPHPASANNIIISVIIVAFIMPANAFSSAISTSTTTSSATSSGSGSNNGKKNAITIGKAPMVKTCWCGDDCSCCVIPCTVM